MEESKQLKNAGLKITLPRLKVLQILEQSPNHHLSAEGVYKALLETGEDVGLATVYRVLTQFEAAGLVSRHNFEGGYSVFEVDQGLHHDHLVCIKCGYVDTFRHFIKDGGHYTWWDYYTGARARDVGWRIDYFFVTENLLPKLKKAYILKDVMGSDHCPIGIELKK